MTDQYEIRTTPEPETKKGQIIVGVVENDRGEVLIILRKKEKVWAFPSGMGATVKYNETPEQAINSEVAYDTKLKIGDAQELIHKPILGDKKVDEMIAFVCKARGDQTVEPNGESVLGYAWVKLDDPRLENLPFDQPEVLAEYKKFLESKEKGLDLKLE